MKPTKFLPKLENSATHSIRRYTKLINSIELNKKDEANLKMSYVIIGLTNLLSNFHKAFYLSCARGPTGHARQKVTYTHAYANDDDLLGVIITHFKPTATRKSDGSWSKRDELTRYELQHIEFGLNHIISSKLIDLLIVQDMNLGVYRDMPAFRNYYAHANSKTQKSARRMLANYLIPVNIHPTNALMERPGSRSISLILDWIDEAQISINTLCS